MLMGFPGVVLNGESEGKVKYMVSCMWNLRTEGRALEPEPGQVVVAVGRNTEVSRGSGFSRMMRHVWVGRRGELGRDAVEGGARAARVAILLRSTPAQDSHEMLRLQPTAHAEVFPGRTGHPELQASGPHVHNGT